MHDSSSRTPSVADITQSTWIMVCRLVMDDYDIANAINLKGKERCSSEL